VALGVRADGFVVETRRRCPSITARVGFCCAQSNFLSEMPGRVTPVPGLFCYRYPRPFTYVAANSRADAADGQLQE